MEICASVAQNARATTAPLECALVPPPPAVLMTNAPMDIGAMLDNAPQNSPSEVLALTQLEDQFAELEDSAAVATSASKPSLPKQAKPAEKAQNA